MHQYSIRAIRFVAALTTTLLAAVSTGNAQLTVPCPSNAVAHHGDGEFNFHSISPKWKAVVSVPGCNILYYNFDGSGGGRHFTTSAAPFVAGGVAGHPECDPGPPGSPARGIGSYQGDIAVYCFSHAVVSGQTYTYRMINIIQSDSGSNPPVGTITAGYLASADSSSPERQSMFAGIGTDPYFRYIPNFYLMPCTGQVQCPP